jgi:hypothetical protein
VPARDIVLRVLFFRSPDNPNTWIAQALEHDICASGGPDIEHAKRAFEETLRGYFSLSERHHVEPLSTLKPAPAWAWDTWKMLAQAKLQAERVPSIPAYMMPVVQYDALPA